MGNLNLDKNRKTTQITINQSKVKVFKMHKYKMNYIA